VVYNTVKAGGCFFIINQVFMVSVLNAPVRMNGVMTGHDLVGLGVDGAPVNYGVVVTVVRQVMPGLVHPFVSAGFRCEDTDVSEFVLF